MGRYGQTDIHPLALLLTLCMGVAMLMVRRDRAVWPLLIVACLVTHAQRVVVGGLDFSMLRLLILFGWARLLFRGETSSYRHHPLDTAIIVWQLLALFAYVIGPRASGASFVFRLGLTVDSLGMYFLFRILLRDVLDIQRSIGAFSWIALAMVIPMGIEHLTGRNLFAALGSVPEFTRIRDGRLRAQASFSHPIMAGNFGATTAALVGALWLTDTKHRLRQTIALAAASAITILSSSSGPLMAWLTAGVAWALWTRRRDMRTIRWVTFGVLLFLHLVREQPVWHLLARLSSITGGTGFHRFKLIDEAIAHFPEWWLAGAGSTAHWSLAQASDITNQYILEGVRGGIAALIAFVVVLALGFRTVGRCVRALQASPQLSLAVRRRMALLAWGLGVCLAAHSVAFIGVSYFGQLLSILFLHMAMIPSFATALARVPATLPVPQAPAPQPAPPALGPAPASVGAALRRSAR